MGPLFIGIRIQVFEQLFCPFDLAAADISLVFHHLPGKSDDHFLFYGCFGLYHPGLAIFQLFFFIKAQVESVVSIYDLIGFVIV